MKSLKKAKGITLIGFIFVLAILGLFLYAGMQLGPVYMDNMSVVKAMKTAASEGGNQSPAEIKTRITKLLDISFVDQVSPKDIKIVRGNGREIQVKYEVEKKFFYNLSFLMRFDERVSLN